MLFSKRYAQKSPNPPVQKESMNIDLRTSLWNCLNIHYWYKYPSTDNSLGKFKSLFQSYWLDVLKKPIDDVPYKFIHALQELRAYFFECEWSKVYDIIETTSAHFPSEQFQQDCNIFLEEENSAYRFIDSKIVEITSDIEIETLEQALENLHKFPKAYKHLKQALNFLTHSKDRSYRHSMSESINAIEDIARNITGDPNATLGKAAKALNLHKALQDSLSNLYGYASDQIRHAMKSESEIPYEDAKFILVLSSSFMNYILLKENVDAKCAES